MTRILIVDDQLSFRRRLRALLERAGLEVVGEAGDISAAEAFVISRQPDLAMVDVFLPGTSGIEGIRRLKALAPRLRVILMSAYHESAWKEAALAAGAEAFVLKDDLDLALVQTWADRKKGETR